MTLRFIATPAFVVICATSLSLGGCDRKVETRRDSPPPPALETLVTKREMVRREQIWDGVVEAVHEATMSAQTSGRVLELPFDVNDYVPAGALIVRLTDVEQQAAQRNAQANSDETEANYARIAKLYEKKIVAKAALDQAHARRESAAAALRTAQQQLEYTAVKAPYSGYVTKRLVNVGEEVQPGNPLISGISLAALRVNVEVPQSAATAIRTFGSADVLLDSLGTRRVRASKITLFPYADPQTHSFSVRLDLPEEETGLYPGMTVKVAFEVGEAERLLVPISALVQRSEVSGVYVVNDDLVSLRQLRLGHRFADRIEVHSGLQAGEHVAVDPVAAALSISERHKGKPSS